MSSPRSSAPGRRMSVRDAGFLYLERPEAGLHIGCLAVFERGVTLDALRRRVEARLPRLPRYVQRAMPVPFGARPPELGGRPGLRRARARAALVAAGAGRREHELGSWPRRCWRSRWRAIRPLWEMHLIEGLDDERCALLQKVHHCMVDGIAGVRLLDEILDREPSPPERCCRCRRAPQARAGERRRPRAGGRRAAQARGRRSLSTRWRGPRRAGRRGAAARRGLGRAPAGHRRPAGDAVERPSARVAASPSRGCRSRRCGACGARAAAP